MTSSKKKSSRELGISPSERRSRSPHPTIGGFSFPVPATIILDVPRVRDVWEEWYESGVVDRHWDLGVYLEITTHFLREGLIDWSGLEEMKPIVRAVLGRLRSGEMTLEDCPASINRSCRDRPA